MMETNVNSKTADSDLCRLPLERLDSYEHLLRTTKPVLEMCKHGHENRSVIVGLYDNFGLYYRCQEPDCNFEWVVCCACTKNRTWLETRRAVYAHKNIHKKMKQSANMSAVPSDQYTVNQDEQFRIVSKKHASSDTIGRSEKHLNTQAKRQKIIEDRSIAATRQSLRSKNDDTLSGEKLLSYDEGH